MVKPLFCERVLDAAAGYYPPVTTPCRPRFTQGLQLRPTPGAYRQNLIGDTGFERGIALRAIGGVFVKRFAISAALFSLILFSLAAQAHVQKAKTERHHDAGQGDAQRLTSNPDQVLRPSFEAHAKQQEDRANFSDGINRIVRNHQAGGEGAENDAGENFAQHGRQRHLPVGW